MVEQLLQATDPDWFQYWKDMQWFKAVFEPLIWRFGRAGIGLLIGAPFTMALWQQAESVVPPAVMLTLFMGLLLGGAPAGATIGGYLIIVVATAVAYRSIFGGER
ncbi:hypothetical protein [Haloplanus halophilus]|uniref:hypothetical protein n=1 Tax=Haloplanus halophilus TaxID=2949993 RepID=UPI00203E3BFA|nr:hypothetical protein [Haloplanus sp. GDY1]